MLDLKVKKIGILGGGQLGRMIAKAAHQLGFVPVVFTDIQDSPAVQVTKNSIVAGYDDEIALSHFAQNVDIVTIEFENIPLKVLNVLEKSCKVAPSSAVIKIAQNRILEKQFLNANGIKTAAFKVINSLEDLSNFPVILKTAEQGYDGKGQFFLKDKTHLSTLKSFKFPAIAEEVIDFKKELSVIVARNKKSLVNFPVAENVHSSGILLTSKVPAEINKEVEKNAIDIAKKISTLLDIEGIIAVEFFLTKNDELLVNEIAPRPHNSGHWSLDCCDVDQFSILLLAITDSQLKTPHLIYPCEMRNLLGDSIKLWNDYLLLKNHKVYLYGKNRIERNRKMGHVNVILP